MSAVMRKEYDLEIAGLQKIPFAHKKKELSMKENIASLKTDLETAWMIINAFQDKYQLQSPAKIGK